MPRKLNICIIDDAMALCLELRDALEQSNSRVSCLPLSQARPAFLAAQRLDLIILGIPCFASSAMTLYRKLIGHQQLRHVPLIVASNDADLDYETLDAFDFLCRPFDFGRLQASLGRLAATRSQAPLTVIAPDEIEPFKEFLHQHSGLHFNPNNQRGLERALLRRARALRMAKPAEYFRYLSAVAENFDESNKLLGLLTVGETSFFRYRSHREALALDVIPQLLERNRASKTLRIWSAGCSTGEEPYSLAILLLEQMPSLADWDIQILATDINKRALRQAREGIYGPRALRMMEEPLVRRHFHSDGEHHLIGRPARKLVRFAYLNLQADPYPSDLDLILCRNVLIYFKTGTVRRIVTRFNQALKPGGFLFMGHSETMQNISDRFRRHHRHNAFYYQQKEVAETPAPTTPPRPPAQQRKRKLPPSDPDQLFKGAMTAFDHEQFGEASRLFEEVLEANPKYALAMVGKGLLLANDGHYSEARRYCARAIGEDDLLPEAYLLRGLILDMEGLLERALVEYQKVLWLEPGFVMAHYLSAKVYERQGESEKWRRALRNASRLLEQFHDEATIPFSGGLSRSVFLDILRGELVAAPPD
jgi:chemotaxis protein methyltransferase CheR